jgi:hypothetical protein
MGMTDRTGKEHPMKRTALILGIVAALTVPATAAAGSSPEVKPENKAEVVRPEVSTVHVAQVYRVKTHVAQIHRVKAARVSVERATTYRISLRGISR